MEWERAERERLEPIIEKMRTEYKIQEKRYDDLVRRAASGDDDAHQEVLKLAENMPAGPPSYPRLFTNDATPEAVVRLLAENDGRMGVFSAEGGEVFSIMAGRYTGSTKGNLEVFLKGHAGDAIRVDRSNREREPIRIDNPALSTVLCIQPQVMEEAWKNPHLNGRGLLARFLCVLPENPLGKRDIRPESIPKHVLQEYEKRVNWLLETYTKTSPKSDMRLLRTTAEADRLLTDFQGELEPELGPGGKYEGMSGWVGKLAGTVARIAGCLQLASHPPESESVGTEIDQDTMKAALDLGRFYLAHAERAYSRYVGSPVHRMAQRILDTIQERAWDAFSLRDVYRVLGVKKNRVTHPLAILEEHGYIRSVVEKGENRSGKKGRPPGPKWEVHPALLESFVNNVNFVDNAET
jgi:hypothetical protein